jgi:opacity protein-like surface antigen
MKRNQWLTAAVAALTLALQPTTSVAGPYISIDGGAFMLGDLDVNNLGLNVDSGYGLNFAVGLRSESGFGIELQTGYYTNDFAGDFSLFGSRVDVQGDIRTIPLFVNANYKASLIGPLAIELGAGAGVFFGSTDISASASIGGRTFSVSQSENTAEFSLQGLAGLHLDLGANVALKAGYRYFRFFESELNGHFVGGGLVINF